MRLELTREGLLVVLGNNYSPARGALFACAVEYTGYDPQNGI